MKEDLAMVSAPDSAIQRDGAVSLNLRRAVEQALAATSIIDVHTHLFAPCFGELGLWGIDDLLTYHYLEAEFFRFSSLRPDDYWALDKRLRADEIWKTLFIENPPLSEATRGVISVLDALGLDTASSTLAPLREFFEEQQLESYLPRVFELAGIDSVVMTNDPLDRLEMEIWNRSVKPDSRFYSALRLDRLINEYSAHHQMIASQGYDVDAELRRGALSELRRFVVDWCERMDAVYMAASVSDTFAFPGDSIQARLLSGAILPACRELDVPLALMIGVRRQVNPALRLAGDAAGLANLRAVENLCRDFPDQRFLVSVLSLENQHELCIIARKFNNLMPFGCWWFLNNPSIVEEITRERLEMLGTSFIPQHSDARILEQLIYKWRNTRRTMAPILTNACELVVQDGRPITQCEIQRIVTQLFRSNFERWTRVPQFESGMIST